VRVAAGVSYRGPHLIKSYITFSGHFLGVEKLGKKGRLRQSIVNVIIWLSVIAPVPEESALARSQAGRRAIFVAAINSNIMHMRTQSEIRKAGAILEYLKAAR